MNKYLNLAIERAKNHKFDDSINFNLCAVVIRGGNILSVGFNKRATNGFVEHYTDKIRGARRGYALSTHAEMDAVSSARTKVDLRGCKIFVARINLFGDKNNLGMARPCQICQNILYSYGIRRAFYTIDNNNYGVMRIASSENPIVNDKHCCSGSLADEI
jgi:pyrimidine deaminase RibD-like protein